MHQQLYGEYIQLKTRLEKITEERRATDETNSNTIRDLNQKIDELQDERQRLTQQLQEVMGSNLTD